jgi:hypothetical protein
MASGTCGPGLSPLLNMAHVENVIQKVAGNRPAVPLLCFQPMAASMGEPWCSAEMGPLHLGLTQPCRGVCAWGTRKVSGVYGTDTGAGLYVGARLS